MQHRTGRTLHPDHLRSCRVRPARLGLPRTLPRAVPRSQPDDVEPGPSASDINDLPPELQGLRVREDGFLIDSRTGKVINEMGATRFDVAVRALRGELDPPAWVENTERTPGVILSALYQFPRSYLFQVVGRPLAGRNGDAPAASAAMQPASNGRDGDAAMVGGTTKTATTAAAAAAATDGSPGNGSCGKAAFVRDVTATILRVTQAQVEEGKVEVKERLGGKYVSVAVDVMVRAPELVSMVYDELAKDPRVIMKF